MNETQPGKKKAVGSSELLAAAAVKWWESNRPTGMTLEEHMRNPKVNCRNNCDDNLAVAVSKYISANS